MIKTMRAASISVERRLQVAVTGAEPAHGEQRRAVTLLPKALSL